MNGIKQYWESLDTKEQIILGALGLAVVLVSLWLFVYQPISQWKAQQASSVASQQRTLTEVSRLVGQIKANNSNGDQANKGSLLTIVNRTLDKNGLKMVSFTPNRDGTGRLQLENVTYEPLMQWLYDLEYKENVQVMDINIVQTSPGLLSVKNIRLRKP